jgi:hypothetical protein
MRKLTQACVLSLVAVLTAASLSQAVPLTSGGPGGVGTTDGSSDLELWLRGDKGLTLSGSGVTAWADQSGNGNHVIPNSLAQLPTTGATQNSTSVITFNPANPAPPGAVVTTQFFKMASGNFTIGGNNNVTSYAAYTQNQISWGQPFFGRTVNYFGLHSNNVTV